MATYTFIGYAPSEILSAGGSNYMLDPNWDSTVNGYRFEFTDDDANADGDTTNNDVGNDSNQMLVVRDASGTLIASGKAYLEDGYTYTDANGIVQTVYSVRIGSGPVLGYIGTAPIMPGVVMTWTGMTNPASVAYASLASNTYDPDNADSIKGGSNADSIKAGAGNDTITSGAGADTIDGGAGNDTIYYGQGGATSVQGSSISGGDGNDLIDDISGNNSWVYNDTIDGGAGNDTVYAAAGNDLVYGGSGDDSLDGEDGDDTLYGGTGNDTVRGRYGNDLVYGDEGDDWVMGGYGNDTVYGGDGNDSIVGDVDNDLLYGGADADTFIFNNAWGNDTIFGGSTTTTGIDFDTLDFTYYTAGGLVVTFTDTGDGHVAGGTNYAIFDDIEGVRGSSGADTVDATGDSGGIWASMEAGDDVFIGGAGNDTVYGGAGNDSLSGGAGNDLLFGEDGNDTLDGGAGNDTLTGGAGLNTLRGGADSDIFRLYATDGQTHIEGGETGADWDTIELSGGAATVTWTGFEAGTVTFDGGVTHDFIQIEHVSGTSLADYFNAAASTAGIAVDAGAGADTIAGSDFDDVINAGTGDDRIDANAGNDTITTGSGADVVVFSDGDGQDTITDFDLTDDGAGRTIDQFDVTGLTDADGNPVNAWDVTVTDDGGGNAVLAFPNGEQITLTGITPAQVSSAPQLFAMGIPCIVSGMRVETVTGEVPIEDLRLGDLLITRDGPPLPLVWAATREISAVEMQDNLRLCPVEIKAGAMGNRRPLQLSGQHCLWVPTAEGGALVRARHLALCGWGGARIMRRRRGCRYHHLLLPEHALIRVEGAWIESFWPGPIGFAGLDQAGRVSLLQARPALAAGLLGLAPVTHAYHGPVAPILRRREVARISCRNWSGHLALERCS